MEKIIYKSDFSAGLSGFETVEQRFEPRAAKKEDERPTQVLVQNGTFSSRYGLEYSENCVKTENGELVITAKKSENGFESGFVRLSGLSFKDARVSVTAAFPVGVNGLKSLVRAVTAKKEEWLTETEIANVSFPNTFSRINMHVYFLDKCDGALKHLAYLGKGREHPVTDGGFHTYEYERKDGVAAFFYDGEEVFKVNLSHPVMEPFDREYTVEICLEAGGNNLPEITDFSRFPASIRILDITVTEV